ncbi:hypothetical protein [uncultured Zoogloea sp.]|uniref:hypothetical protein n=1 Tax=uncultured Zoogloea sp. TaxID=160237 RepID=UPI002612A1AD|nr:hypothetical protein [uncultured Zoogloea sp.]
MATKKFIGCSVLFGSVSLCNKRNETNKRVELADLMATLMARERAATCLRAQGVPEDQAAQCKCLFCSAETQRERFGETFDEMAAKFAEEEASAAIKAKAREKTRYVHRLLASAGARNNRLKSVAIRGL